MSNGEPPTSRARVTAVTELYGKLYYWSTDRRTGQLRLRPVPEVIAASTGRGE